jgi:ABC-type polysaccharide/polyol phosphate transport system ATPase subunit
VSEAPVVVRALGKRYPGAGELWALREVSFAVDAGSALAVVGENGSGKSTLLDLLLGATRASEGAVSVAGAKAALLELNAGLFVDLTGRENGVQAGLLAGLSREEARRRAEQALAFAELAEAADRPLRTYSAGMAMRLGFALAAASEAPVLLVDEVLAVGDGYFQRKCIDRLLERKAGGAALVVASHDLHALRGLCERALWLRAGRVEALGPSGEVLGRYEEHLRRRSAREHAPRGRQGTGEVVIEGVRLTDGDGGERALFRSGETLRVEVLFHAPRPVESPVMGVALFRDDGVYCYGPNTKFDGVLAGSYAGRYLLIAEFPELPLLTGSYEASVAFYDKDHVYAYAWDHRMYPFRVVSERPDHGVVQLRHRFRVEKA